MLITCAFPLTFSFTSWAGPRSRPLPQRFMPNRYQLTFLASSITVFVSLAGAFHYLKWKLREAGYDISRLILIGLEPRDPANTESPNPDRSLKMASNNLLPQALAGVLAVATTAFLYLKFGQKSESSKCLQT